MSAFWFLCTTHTHTSDEWKTIYYLVLHVLMYKYMNVWIHIYICFVVFLLFVFHIRFQWRKLSLERVWSVVLLFCNFIALLLRFSFKRKYQWCSMSKKIVEYHILIIVITDKSILLAIQMIPLFEILLWISF